MVHSFECGFLCPCNIEMKSFASFHAFLGVIFSVMMLCFKYSCSTWDIVLWFSRSVHSHAGTFLKSIWISNQAIYIVTQELGSNQYSHHLPFLSLPTAYDLCDACICSLRALPGILTTATSSWPLLLLMWSQRRKTINDSGALLILAW